MLELDVTFFGPGGEQYRVPAFWDGGRRWTVRFAAVTPGNWSYTTPCLSDGGDPGLNCRHGAFNVIAADSRKPLQQHGGFLRVSGNKRYLTYSDGTPFFWLADTWWFCPSDLCPYTGSTNPDVPSMFKALVDRRAQEGFSVAQVAFLGPGGASQFFTGPGGWTPERMRFWKNVDEYVSYANDSGLLLAIAIGFHRGLDNVAIDDLKRLWRYVVARYGAFAVTWLVAGEYNLDNDAARVEKVLELGRYIRSEDAYKRAMSVHPWNYGSEGRQAWSQDWYDFVMLQGGHDRFVPLQVYREIYDNQEKPFLEAETMYEGILGHRARETRIAAYRAIQSGSFGYTYGAHGLWYPTQTVSDSAFSEWGSASPWWQALRQVGGEQMRVLRQVYEEAHWWSLQPAPGAIQTSETDIVVKADADRVFLVYFPPANGVRASASLRGTARGEYYTAAWINPRDGSRLDVPERLLSSDDLLLLPPAPDAADWTLIVKKDEQRH